MKHQLLPTVAIATTTIALLSATPIPVVGTNDDVRALSILASAVIWFAYIAGRATRQIQQHLGDVHVEVDEIRQLHNIEQLLVDAGVGSTLTLPKPHGNVRSVPANVDGEPVLVGVDESAHLADVIDLRRAMTGGDGRAAQ